MISYSYEPAADVPEEFARAIARPGQALSSAAWPARRCRSGCSQSFEGKRKPEGQDTSSADAPKLRVLSISTSPMTYDFEQAKQPGRTGWATQALTNTFLSDLLPGFSLSLSHDLWRGQVGVDTSDFDPFLQRVRRELRHLREYVSLARAHLRNLGRLRIRPRESGTRRSRATSPSRVGAPDPGRSTAPTRRRFGAVGARSRPASSIRSPAPDRFRSECSRTTRASNLTTNFSPTPFWGLSWSTQYSITDGTVRVASRPPGARSARVAGGVQLRAESHRERLRSTSRST